MRRGSREILPVPAARQRTEAVLDQRDEPDTRARRECCNVAPASTSRAAGCQSRRRRATVVKTSTSRRIVHEIYVPRRAVQADERRASSTTHARERCGRCVRGAADLDHDVEATPPLRSRRSSARSALVAFAVSVAERGSRRRLRRRCRSRRHRPGRRAAMPRDNERSDPPAPITATASVGPCAAREERGARRRVAVSSPPRRHHTTRALHGRLLPATSRARRIHRPPEGRVFGSRRRGLCDGGDTSATTAQIPAPRRPDRRRAASSPHHPLNDPPYELVSE